MPYKKPEQTLNNHTRRPARQTGANLGFEDKLWMAADKLRGTMDAAEYKHVVLELIFLKYISDAFADKYAALAQLSLKEAATACKKELSASDLTVAANVTGSEGIVPGGVQALRDLIADVPNPSTGDHLALPAFLCGVSA